MALAAHSNGSSSIVWHTNVSLRIDTSSLRNIRISIIGIGIRNGIKTTDANFVAILERKNGWGGRIRTFTGLINSEVPYQLDHAPAASGADFGGTPEVGSAT